LGGPLNTEDNNGGGGSLYTRLGCRVDRRLGGRLPCMDHLELARQELIAAKRALDLATGSDRERRLADQDDRVGFELMMLGNRLANPLDDVVVLVGIELAIDLLYQNEPLLVVSFLHGKCRPRHERGVRRFGRLLDILWVV